MPLFSSSTPFDADVEKATAEINTSEDWGLIMDICDRVNHTPNSSKDCLKSIMKRINHRVPHVSMQALTLLDACVNNAGREFKLVIASRDFISDCRNIITSKAHPKVSQKLKNMIKSWTEGEFKTDPALDLIPSFYRSLLSDGVTFTSEAQTPKSAVTFNLDPNTATDSREVDDIAKAIALSLEEDRKKGASTSSAGAGLYPSFNNLPAAPKLKESRQVKALYDFEAAEDNELTFKTGEIITITDDSDQNWWRGTNSRGEGLFPANFVTADLTAEVDDEAGSSSKGSKGKVQFKEDVQVQLIDTQEPIDISEAQIDETLAMLQNADPTGETVADPVEMLALEEQCRAMGPLIDQELEHVDKRHNGLMELNSKVLEALQMYHSLMKQLPAYGYSTLSHGAGAGGPTAQALPQQMYPGTMPYGYAPVRMPSTQQMTMTAAGVAGSQPGVMVTQQTTATTDSPAAVPVAPPAGVETYPQNPTNVSNNNAYAETPAAYYAPPLQDPTGYPPPQEVSGYGPPTEIGGYEPPFVSAPQPIYSQPLI